MGSGASSSTNCKAKVSESSKSFESSFKDKAIDQENDQHTSNSESESDDYDCSQESALNLILKSNRSTSALLKYLEQNDKGCILRWYLDICQYRSTSNDNLIQKASEIKSRYVPNTVNAHQLLINDIWDSVNETLPKEDFTNSSSDLINLFEKLKNAESLCKYLMTKQLQSFFNSYEYSLMYEVNKYFSPCVATRGVQKLTEELKYKYKNILIIEDSPNNCQLMTYVLETNGHHVHQANHGLIGVHLATLNSFDAILIDLSMTTMNPVEVITYIKEKSKRNSDTVIIGLNKNGNKSSLNCNILLENCTSEEIIPANSLNSFIEEFYNIIRHREGIYDEKDTPSTVGIINDEGGIWID